MRITTDTKILLWTIPLALLTIVAGRMEGFDKSDFTSSALICITFVSLVARCYYVSLDLATILLGIFWLFGFLGFYASLWVPTLNVEVLSKLAGVGIVGVLGYIFYDFGRLKKWSKRGAVTRGTVVFVILFLLLFNIFGYTITYKHLDPVVEIAVILAALVIAMSYWSHLSGKPVQWPWEQKRSESGKV